MTRLTARGTSSPAADSPVSHMPGAIGVLYALVECAYLGCLLVTLWLYSRRVDLVDLAPRPLGQRHGPAPDVIVFYPVLDELEATMRTSMLGFARAEYPGGTRRVVAIPNSDDHATIASLERVREEYAFLEILPIPPTSDERWSAVWAAWNENPKAYWWHTGKRAHQADLPPKKTRQLVYAFYTMAAAHPDALLSYIDADSVVPSDYFTGAAAGMESYDVLQNTNVAGNAMASLAASMFAMDHMQWDGSLYQHMSAEGKHPYYVLGKGLFFRVSDLLELGGFNPWLTIEDPEVGMRLWTNGRRLGIIRSPLIEEVPETFSDGITQRKRWVAGFFQSLGVPLTLMGMTLRQRLRARLNLVPCLSLIVNPVGLVLGVWALVAALTSRTSVFAGWLEALSIAAIALAVVVVGIGQRAAFRQTKLIFASRRERVAFMLRVNPVFVLVYWIWWSVPLAIGFYMYLADKGLRWERTPKIDANHDLVRSDVVAEEPPVPSGRV
jgi:hypothetical protein